MGPWLKYFPQKLRTRAQFLRGWVNAGDCGSHIGIPGLEGEDGAHGASGPVRAAIWLNWLWVGLKDLAPMNQSHWIWLLTYFFRTYAHPHTHVFMCVQTCIQTHTRHGSDFADPLVKEAARWECLLAGCGSYKHGRDATEFPFTVLKAKPIIFENKYLSWRPWLLIAGLSVLHSSSIRTSEIILL